MNDAPPPAAAPARNAPCPCGSGRRYKECHGALVAPAAGTGAGVEPRPPALLAALAAQEAGDFAAAIAGYRAVLAEEPDDFDAVHMLGVALLQSNELDEAEALIARAVRMRPDVAAAQANLAVVRQTRTYVVEEASICRSVLPRLARLCVDAPPMLLDGVGAGERVEVVFAGSSADAVLAQRIDAAAAARGAAVSASTIASRGPSGWPRADEERLAALDGAIVVVVGLDAPIGDWPLTARTRSMTLVVTKQDPCLLHDRLREASGQGRRRVALATPDAAMAATAILPMRAFATPERP